MKTIYRVENAQELFDGLSKCRGAGDTLPSFDGHLRIDHNKVSFDGNVDVSLLTAEQVLKEAASRLGLEGITISWPPSTREIEYARSLQANKQA
ncbi:MAG: hypothetical protein LW822_10780 [Phycisphaeraceae bacterium]|nr:hypothetical protein [Phycisphaeraceae bacterium]